MRTCSKCGQQVHDEYALCPFCGADVKTGDQVGVETDGKVGAGMVMGCFTYGAAFFIATAYGILGRQSWVMRHWHGADRPDPPWTLTWPPGVIPLALMVGWYVPARWRAPIFARGLGYSLIVSAALLLGAMAVCR